jgi:hypothetical protein
MIWRHGDVLIGSVRSIPAGARRRNSPILVNGELTGHSHRIETPASTEVWEVGGQLFLRVVSPTARVVHEEHAPISLPRGDYRVWQQREYSPAEIRRVVD